MMEQKKLELAKADFQIDCRERQKSRACLNANCDGCEIKVAIECIDRELSQPEIIHCAECKYLTEDKFYCLFWRRSLVKEDDFCSKAERRTEMKK